MFPYLLMRYIYNIHSFIIIYLFVWNWFGGIDITFFVFAKTWFLEGGHVWFFTPSGDSTFQCRSHGTVSTMCYAKVLNSPVHCVRNLLTDFTLFYVNSGTQPATSNVNDALTGPSSQIGEDNVLQDPGSFHQTDMPTHSGDSFTKVSIEKGRDAVHVSPGIPPMFSSPVQPPSLGTVRKNKDIVPLATEDEDNAGSGGQISPLQQSSGPRASFASLHEEPMNIFEGSVSFGKCVNVLFFFFAHLMVEIMHW